MPKCKECKHLIAGISPYNNSRSNWWCAIARTECEPHRRIAQAKGDVIHIKTSPHWCPLKGGVEMITFRLKKAKFPVWKKENGKDVIVEVQGEIFEYLGKECGIYRAEHRGDERKYDYFAVTLETGRSMLWKGYARKLAVLQKLEDPELIAQLQKNL